MDSDITAQGEAEVEIETGGSQVTSRRRASVSAADADAGTCAGRACVIGCVSEWCCSGCFCSVYVGARVTACKRARTQVCVRSGRDWMNDWIE